jgi:hypothetical protein
MVCAALRETLAAVDVHLPLLNAGAARVTICAAAP